MVCTYEKTIFENKENGFCIAAYRTTDPSVPAEARNGYIKDNSIHFTATGYQLPTINTIDFDLTGNWEKSKYGMQLHVQSFIEVIPKTEAGIIGYLSSGLIHGVGEKMGKKIVGLFGLDTLNILENSPERLLEVKGITQRKLDKIIASYKESTAIREIVTYLTPFGISVAKAVKIKKEFGDKSMEVLKTQPFLLCSIKGFAFKTVDAIARKTACRLNDSMRIRGALGYVLDEAASGAGHLYLFQKDLRNQAYDLLNDGFAQEVVTGKEVYLELSAMISEKQLINDNQNIYRPYFWYAECDVAEAIYELLKGKLDLEVDLDAEITQAQQTLGITLSPAQIQAVRMCFEHQVSVITGGPGTGKTTILKVIMEVYRRIAPKSQILLTAPTGRAARRMSESTGFLNAQTMHAALGLISDENDYINGSEMLDYDFIIADELSMMDMQLAKEFFTRLQPEAHVLLVGDPDQLPSVGAGNVLREIINAGVVPVTSLDVVFRQAKNSRIMLNAQKINSGDTQLMYGPDFQFVDAETEEDTLAFIRSAYKKEIAENGVDAVQILSPMRQKCITGTKALNETLQEIANPARPGIAEVKYGTKVFRKNDRVLQLRNMEEVSNGDVGYIRGIYKNDSGTTVTVEFSGGRVVDYESEDLAMLDHAYAMTIHKSQGSEFQTIIVPLLKRFYRMLRRNLVYTGITRSKEKVILIGQRAALAMAIRTNDVNTRNTMLSDRIKNLYAQDGKKRAC